MIRHFPKYTLPFVFLAVVLAVTGIDPRSAAAQTDVISHEITSWNLDGTVTVSITFRLPDGFADRVGDVTATTTCGEATDCRASNVAVTGDV